MYLAQLALYSLQYFSSILSWLYFIVFLIAREADGEGRRRDAFVQSPLFLQEFQMTIYSEI